MDSEVPPPSVYSNTQSKEHTILLKKMAHKQQQVRNNKSHKKSQSSLINRPTKVDDEQNNVNEAMKKEISATCDCVTEMGQIIETISERITRDTEALKNEFNFQLDSINENNKKELVEVGKTIETASERMKTDIETLKKEFNLKFDAIDERTNQLAKTNLNVEVAITELYKKVQFIEQILITDDERDNLEQTKKAVIKSNLPKSKPPSDHPESISILDNIKPIIDNNLVDSVQSAGSHSVRIKYDV